jgi:hypothetical protein
MFHLFSGGAFFEDGTFRPPGVAHPERLDGLPNVLTLALGILGDLLALSGPQDVRALRPRRPGAKLAYADGLHYITEADAMGPKVSNSDARLAMTDGARMGAVRHWKAPSCRTSRSP